MRFVFALLMLFIAAQFSFAVPAAPSPICGISAKVISMDKVHVPSGDTPGGFRQAFDYYKISLYVTSISTVEQIGEKLCDENYKKTIEKNGAIMSDEEFSRTRMKQGDLIVGKLHFSGDESFSGYFLSDIGPQKNEPEKTQAPDSIILWAVAGFAIVAVILFFFIRKK
jgi:hypothetical protein